MKHQEFIDKYNGKYIDRDGAAGTQCMDLANQYVCEVFGYPVNQSSPIGAPYAYKSFQNGHPDFIKIEGSDISQFQQGDIIYWDLSLGNKAGHVAIFLGEGARGEFFDSFDQNWPEKSPCHQQSHSTASVCGVLRHKSMVKQPDPIQDINPKETMQLFKKAQQMIWTKVDGIAKYYVIWLREKKDANGNIIKDAEGKPVMEEVKRLLDGSTGSQNRARDIFSGAGKYFRWSTPEQLEILSRLPSGELLDINVLLDKYPELLEQ